MNAVNRPRGRPRKSSVNFRVFFRVLLYEAASRVHAWPGTVRPGAVLRHHAWEWRSDVVRRWAEREIAREPERRIAP